MHVHHGAVCHRVVTNDLHLTIAFMTALMLSAEQGAARACNCEQMM